MKRDIDLTRKLTLDLEDAEGPLTHAHVVQGYTVDQIAYHLGLIVREGLADGPAPLYSSSTRSTVPSAVIALRLTPAGHDFIDTLRSEAVWSRVKDRAKHVGSSLSLDMLKGVGVEVAKQLLGLAM